MRTMNITPEMAQAMTKAFAMTLQMLVAQPAETVTQTVVSVANKAAAKVTGQRRIATAIKAKVKALRSQNGGPLHSHDPTWKLIDDEIVTEQGDLIADAKAPTAAKQSNRKITLADAAKMNRADMAQHLSRDELLAHFA